MKLQQFLVQAESRRTVAQRGVGADQHRDSGLMQHAGSGHAFGEELLPTTSASGGTLSTIGKISATYLRIESGR